MAVRHRTLEEVMAWALAEGSSVTLRRVLGQDEYTFDVVFDAGECGFLVYDVT